MKRIPKKSEGGVSTIDVMLVGGYQLFDMQLAIDNLPFVLEGLGLTLFISFISFVMSVFGGTILALMRMSRHQVVGGIASLYISFFRGVPVLVTLFFLYFGLPFMGVTLDALHVSLIGFSLTSCAYSSEIIRASILGIHESQWEASYALGSSYWRTLQRIILPQAMIRSIPPLSNVLLDLVKSSSLTAMITVPEIFQKAKIVGGAANDYMTMYFLVAIIYWVICTAYGYLQKQLEKRLDGDQPDYQQNMSI